MSTCSAVEGRSFTALSLAGGPWSMHSGHHTGISTGGCEEKERLVICYHVHVATCRRNPSGRMPAARLSSCSVLEAVTRRASDAQSVRLKKKARWSDAAIGWRTPGPCALAMDCSHYQGSR
ncbi:hypothetical protein EYF80_025737 [Liparis tanakae]|uniref:Uncharacterized protein n=1 Tax=Liparis tanakae TaxID=230148 RepID=A0A4Z2HGG6_9TELE|nr:hypothetical protein EYF80_025737 [Liparis tanakae]